MKSIKLFFALLILPTGTAHAENLEPIDESIIEALYQTLDAQYQSVLGMIEENRSQILHQEVNAETLEMKVVAILTTFVDKFGQLRKDVTDIEGEVENKHTIFEGEIFKINNELDGLTQEIGRSAELVTMQGREKAQEEVINVVRSRKETTIYVSKNEPTIVSFRHKILGGFKRRHAAINLDREERSLAIFQVEEMPIEGEAIVVRQVDGPWIGLRIMPADEQNPRDVVVELSAD